MCVAVARSVAVPVPYTFATPMPDAAPIHERARTAVANVRLCWLGLVLLFWLLLQFHGPLGARNDDVYHAQILQQQTLWQWLPERYATWSARIVIDAVMVLVLPHTWLWRILNAVMLVLLLWSIAALLRRADDLRMLLFLALGFCLMDRVMVAESVWWVTGSFNYLWPAALGGLALLPFARPELPARIFWLSLPATAYAAFQEQAMALLLVFQAILGWGLWRQRLLRPWHIVQIGVCALCALVILASPGAARRFHAIVELWFPDYGRLGLAERLFSGLQLGLGHGMGGGAGWLLVVLLAALLLWHARMHQRTAAAYALAGVPLALLLLPSFWQFAFPTVIVTDVHVSPMPSMRTWTQYSAAAGGLDYPKFWIGDPAHRASPMLYATAASMAAVALAMAGALWRTFHVQGGNRRAATLAVLVWGAAFCATVLIGLTPTLYMSTQRIYFAQDVLTLGLAAAVFARVIGARGAVPAARPG